MGIPGAKLLTGATAVVVTGVVLGATAALLESLGNPPNMGICVVCFERDLAVLEPSLWPGGPVQRSAAGPGAMAAPLVASLGAGLLIGVLAQRTRFCTIGAVRNLIFGGRLRLPFAVLGFVAAGLLIKLADGTVRPGFTLQPLAHSDILWNFLGMLLAGIAFTLAGGCPGRQLVLAGEGDRAAGFFLLGALAGAALSHVLGLAALPDRVVKDVFVSGGPPALGKVSVVVGIVICAAIGVLGRRSATS